MRRSAADLIVLADDLSGAAESAAALVTATGSRGVPVHLLTRGDGTPRVDPTLPAVIDTNTRMSSLDDLDELLAPVAALVSERSVTIKKVDSLLRGSFAAEIEWLQRTGRPVVVAPALPSAGRIVRDGRVLVQGIPLEETDAWSIESASPPASIQKSFSTPTRLLPLDLVRGPGSCLDAALAETTGIVVCDAESEADLRRIAEAALTRSGPVPILVGASALVAAVAQFLAPGAAAPRSPATGTGASSPPDRRHLAPPVAHVVFAVGTAEPSAQRQVSRLEDAGAAVLRLDPARLIADVASASAAIEKTIAHPVSAVTFDLSVPAEPAQRGILAVSLADALIRAGVVGAGTALVLTGGHTARTVLDGAGIDHLTVLDEIDPGAARAVTGSGIPVVTRPGSFGDDDSFLRIAAALTATASLTEGRTT